NGLRKKFRGNPQILADGHRWTRMGRAHRWTRMSADERSVAVCGGETSAGWGLRPGQCLSVFETFPEGLKPGENGWRPSRCAASQPPRPQGFLQRKNAVAARCCGPAMAYPLLESRCG